MFDEIRPLVGFEKYYYITNRGWVWSLRGARLLKEHLGNNGYYYVNICKKNRKDAKIRQIHQLVASTFLGPKPDGKNIVIDHINGNKTDNRVTNLRYCTYSENAKNAHRNRDINKNIRKRVCKLDKDTGEILEIYNSIYEASKKNNMIGNVSNIVKCCKGIYSSLNGFKWRYADADKPQKIKLEKDEIFKKIPKMNGHKYSKYRISNYGKIKNIENNKFLSPPIVGGYYYVGLRDNNGNRTNYRIHRLVAITFCPKNDINYNDYVVNHIDENKLNNHYKNLEWLTTKENIQYSVGIKVEQIDLETDEILNVFGSISEANQYLGKDKTSPAIKRCFKGIARMAYGFKWRLVE